MSEGILPAKSIDRRLVKRAALFNATPEDLSEAVMGQLTPAQAVERLNELLENVTILDEVKERRLLLMQMSEHLDWIKNHRDNPKAWGGIARQFKLVSDQLERTEIKVEDISSKLAIDHARMFVDGFTLGFERALKALTERHDEIVIDDEEILELTEVGVKASEEYIEKVTVAAS